MKRIVKAFTYSWHGLMAAWSDRAAFFQECIAAAIMVPLAFFIAPTKPMLCLMVGSIFLVLMAELMNTAIEAAVDHTGKDIHPLAKKAKDTASAAVLMAFVNCGFIWAAALFF